MSTHFIDGELIHTRHDYPPIPDRRWDWSAISDNYEPGWPIGHGRTEHEAIQDLLEMMRSEDEIDDDYADRAEWQARR